MNHPYGTLAEQYETGMNAELQKQKDEMAGDVDLMKAMATIGNVHVTQVTVLTQIIRNLEDRLAQVESRL